MSSAHALAKRIIAKFVKGRPEHRIGGRHCFRHRIDHEIDPVSNAFFGFFCLRRQHRLSRQKTCSSPEKTLFREAVRDELNAKRQTVHFE
jgi:hypothetical protein